MDFQSSAEGTVVRLIEHGYRDTTSGRKAILECNRRPKRG